VDKVGRLDALQDHVHDGDDVGEGLLLLAVEGALLKRSYVFGGEVLLFGQVLVGLAKETDRAVVAGVDALAVAGLS
jgi:hypothetical protein